ncbi:sulfite reductase, beta subunit (hemoprotein) [Terriglobus roseus DSM 18391]|uniref:Sulfite reductase, beta subunit (Hemoprotein) n=1 Tax=Terriglobus roseus (strain DSM 18391 / NRRL B-41598 / KBS 63) TaxID=926566 RepID=I3ZFD8_TERRK|nr:nitrite reductase [Terriglobus roseus]AFL87956.1 sulfite reductase, beta subunit (hemoprotein) [Terriglobus roseus DSM 18391]
MADEVQNPTNAAHIVTPVETAAPLKPVKETKAQKSERLKLEKNPWETWEEVRQFAREGREAVMPDWANFYFKWWGIYTQGDGVGAVGGVGGEGKVTDYFMMRVGIPNGILTSDQTRVIADIARDHGRDLADITTRQNIQFHWLTIESLPLVVDALSAVGLTPKGACGDVVRNVTGCPLAGLHKHELIDAAPLAQRVGAHLTAHPDFVNLPRKFKITITGCPEWCSYPEINDIALTGAERTVDGKREVGYSVRVAGGLSKDPHLAIRLNAFIKPEEAEEVCYKITEIFRDQQGTLRESRTHARMKFMFIKDGWTAETFLAELERKLGYKLDPAPDEIVPDDLFRDHTGVLPQQQDGLSSVGITVLRGRLNASQLRTLADLADEFGNGDLRCTIQQNIIIVNVPNEKVQALIARINALDLHVDATNFWRGTVACTGTEFCKLAISETKGFARWLVDEMEDRVPNFDQQLRINVTGCPNNCGQAWIADIGLEGKKIKHEGQMVDAFYFCLGGALGKHAGFARAVGYRVPATEVPVAMERLLKTYLKDRSPEENLRQYFARFSDEELRGQLAGAVVAAVERDKPSGRPPADA